MADDRDRDATIAILEAHVENLIERVRDLEAAHRPFYIAECTTCGGVVGDPASFREPLVDPDWHRAWCETHVEATGHDVQTRIEWRHQ